MLAAIFNNLLEDEPSSCLLECCCLAIVSYGWARTRLLCGTGHFTLLGHYSAAPFWKIKSL